MSVPRDPISGAGDTLTAQSYQVYFRSGLYDRRYPTPNRTMLRRILARVSPQTAVLDFGCGTGRYLLRLQGRVARAAGYDVSPEAIGLVRARADAQGWTDLAVLGPQASDLSAYIARAGRVDLVLCLFGVLGHIADPEARAGALAQMRETLVPGAGRLMVSVPNKARRFRAEQRHGGLAGQRDLVQYTRHANGADVVLNYQLYDVERLRSELGAAGFTVLRMGCESVLSETLLTRWTLARWIDQCLVPICPTRWGYGIYAEASC